VTCSIDLDSQQQCALSEKFLHLEFSSALGVTIGSFQSEARKAELLDSVTLNPTLMLC